MIWRFQFQGPQAFTDQRTSSEDKAERLRPDGKLNGSNKSTGKLPMTGSPDTKKAGDIATLVETPRIREQLPLQDEHKLVKRRISSASQKQSKRHILAPDEDWTEWGVYAAPVAIEDAPAAASGARSKSKRQWIPRLRSRQNQDGSIDIVFLQRER